MKNSFITKAAVVLGAVAILASAVALPAYGAKKPVPPPTPSPSPFVLTPGLDWSMVTSSAAWGNRFGHASVVANNKMWVLGGAKNGYAFTPANDVWYSSATDGVNWTQATASAPWTARFAPSSVVFNNNIWVLGGFNMTTGTLNDVWYSPATDGVNWTQATASAPWTGRQTSLTVFNDGSGDKMWIAGGMFQNGYTQFLNDVWNSSDGVNWTQVTSSAPWIARRYNGLVSFNGKLWVIGGLDTWNDALNDVWNSSDGVNWTQEVANAPWTARGIHQTVVADGKIWILGGLYILGNDTSTEVHLNDVWNSSDGVNWTQITSGAPWSGREGHTSVFANDKLWVMGGGVDVGNKADVWSSRIVNFDTVTINRAEWRRNQGGRLYVEAQSTLPGTATLTLQGFGTMTYSPTSTLYTFLRTGISNPGTVTVISDHGGIATSTVTVP